MPPSIHPSIQIHLPYPALPYHTNTNTNTIPYPTTTTTTTASHYRLPRIAAAPRRMNHVAIATRPHQTGQEPSQARSPSPRQTSPPVPLSRHGCQVWQLSWYVQPKFCPERRLVCSLLLEAAAPRHSLPSLPHPPQFASADSFPQIIVGFPKRQPRPHTSSTRDCKSW